MGIKLKLLFQFVLALKKPIELSSIGFFNANTNRFVYLSSRTFLNENNIIDCQAIQNLKFVIQN